MAHIICIGLQKGGASKTTTAVNLAAELGAQGRKVLLIDMDAQANTTFASGINQNDLKNSMYNVLTTDAEYQCSIEQAVLNLKYYDLLPGDKDIADLVLELHDQNRLKEVLTPAFLKPYDYVIIDTPPALNIVANNVFVASESVIIPLKAEPFYLTGLSDLNDTIKTIKAKWNPSFYTLGILLTLFDERTNLSKTMKKLITDFANDLETSCFDTVIRRSIVVPDSQLVQLPLLDFDPKSKPAVDYHNFALEVERRLK